MSTLLLKLSTAPWSTRAAQGAHATAARDALKKEALRRAGIGYVEVVAGDTPEAVRRVVERLMQQN